MSPNFDHLLSNMIDFVEQSVFLKRHRRQLIVDLVALDRRLFDVGLKLKKIIFVFQSKNLTIPKYEKGNDAQFQKIG